MHLSNIFNSDGKLVNCLNKIGQVIMLNVLFLICCIPIVTIGSSITAFYYAMIKAVRRERSYPAKEFFQSFKRTFVNGIIFTIGTIGIGAIIYFNREYVAKQATASSPTMVIIYDILFILLILLLTFLFPVMSRFSLKATSLLRLAFIMALRHLPFSIALTAGTILCGMLLLWVLPIPFILILPGAWCYVSTFLVEPVLKKYMPKPQEGEDAWYYE